jgi:peptidoglycan/LPS O-acetylase OafA/YrhL
MERVYFRGLNAIRALAAMFVIWWHIEEYKGHFQVMNDTPESWFFLARYGMAGNDAVLVFFVLSGFLITYLLLMEVKTDGQINIPKFYLRRTLRIWPVYYMVVLLGFVLVPIVIKVTDFSGFYISVSNGFLQKFLLFFFFLPNVAHALRIFPIGLMHLWTIGVEEAFYVFWPQLAQRFRRNILIPIVGILVFRLLVLYLFKLFVPSDTSATLEGFNLFLLILTKYPFEGMAIGALGAYILFNRKEHILNLIYHPVSKAVILLLLLLNISLIRMVSLIPTLGMFTEILFACLYISFILNLVNDRKFLPFLDRPIFDFLGKLSYGIYMYHMFVIYFLLIFFEKIQWTDNSFFYNVVLYSLTTLGTVGVAYISYRWLETPFLNLKKKFQTVESAASQDGVVSTQAEAKA